MAICPKNVTLFGHIKPDCSRAERALNSEQARPGGGVHLLSDRIKTVSKAHLKQPLGLSVERRADSPGYWKD
jgi:hypothetical protein